MGRKRRRKWESKQPTYEVQEDEGIILVSPPTASLEEYLGPYPIEDMREARQSLINSIQGARGLVWDGLKEKLGILPSGKRIESAQQCHWNWLTADVPFSQWCCDLTLVPGAEHIEVENARKLQVESVTPGTSQTSHDENVDVEFRKAQDGVLKTSLSVSLLCSRCTDMDCSCPLVPSRSAVALDKEDGDKCQQISRKRRGETMNCDVERKRTPMSSYSSRFSWSAEAKTAHGHVSLERSINSMEENIYFSGSVSKQSGARTSAMASNGQTDAREISAADMKVVKEESAGFSNKTVADKKAELTSSSPKCRPKGSRIVAEDAYGNKRKLGPGLEVKNGKAVLSSAGLEDCHLGSLMYKCDYCKVVEATAEDLTYHLQKAQHASGSQCTGQKKEERRSKVPYGILSLGSVENSAALFKTLVPVCPVCHSVHSSVDACTQHTHKVHGLTGAYSLRVVCYKKTLFVTKSNKCYVCKQEFSSYEELSLHWENTKHVSLKVKAPSEMMMFFHCPYCSRTDSDFQASWQHVISEHKHQSISDVCGAVNAIYLGGPAPTRHLMPLFPSGLESSKDRSQAASCKKQNEGDVKWTGLDKCGSQQVKQSENTGHHPQKKKRKKKSKVKQRNEHIMQAVKRQCRKVFV